MGLAGSKSNRPIGAGCREVRGQLGNSMAAVEVLGFEHEAAFHGWRSRGAHCEARRLVDRAVVMAEFDGMTLAPQPPSIDDPL